MENNQKKGLYDQYQYLYGSARHGSDTKRAYGFIVGALRKTRSIGDAADAVRVRLVSLRPCADRLETHVQARTQIAILEHFLEQAARRV